jgi:hypothetical protein
LAGFTAVTLLMLPFLADYPPRDRAAAAIVNPGGIERRPLIQTLVAVFLFQAANMGLSAFLFPLARHAGLADDFISTTLGVANWIGALGSIAVIWLAGRYGRTVPVVAVMVLSLAGTAAFLRSDLGLVFIAANVVTAIGWSFLIPYFFGMCADFDPAGHSATLAGFFSKMGLASGPAAAALLLGRDNYALMVGVSLVGLVLCGLAVIGPARRLDVLWRDRAG